MRSKSEAAVMLKIPVIGRRDNKRKNVGAGQQIAVDRKGQNDRL
jgi:hypothetical protein